MIVIRPATEDDALHVGTFLRDEDQREVRTASQRPPGLVVLESFKMSSECYAVFPVRRGRVSLDACALFGVSPHPEEPGLGLVWLLATDDALRVSRSIMREAPLWLDHLGRNYHALINAADQRNDLHIRWCEATGFTSVGEQEINGFPFTIIYRQCAIQQ
jgi:hypothetical protein